jgi:hypothetical protein
LAAGHWLGIGVGAIVLARRVRHWRVGDDMRAAAANVLRAVVMGVAVFFLVSWLRVAPEIEVVVGVGAGAAIYLALAARGGELWQTMRWLRTPST